MPESSWRLVTATAIVFFMQRASSRGGSHPTGRLRPAGERSVRQARRQASAADRRVRLLILTLATATCLVAMSTALPWLHGERELRQLPLELAGQWVTEDPRYDARFLQLEEHAVIFETGAGQERGTLEEIRLLSAASGTLYRIRYRVAGDDPQELALQLLPDGSLRLGNRQDLVWTRSHGHRRSDPRSHARRS